MRLLHLSPLSSLSLRREIQPDTRNTGNINSAQGKRTLTLGDRGRRIAFPETSVRAGGDYQEL